MKYIEKTLLDNEKVIHWTHPHWIIFVPAFFMLLLASIIYVYGSQLYFLNSTIFMVRVYECFAILCLAVGLYSFTKAYIAYESSEYGVTNKRVLMKIGLLDRSSLEIFLDKIEAVHVEQTFTGRILGYGSIVITGTGGSKDYFLNVPEPLDFRKMIQQEIDNKR